MPNYDEYDCPEHGKSGTDYCPKCADSDQPLTDADLARIERCLPPRDSFDIGGLGTVEGENPAEFGTDDVRALVDEVRRLRSDEWLQRAAEEITENVAPRADVTSTIAQRLDILRKHRDGKP
jgi:hypothetical protein